MVKAMPEDIKQEANKVVNVDFTGQEQWRNDLKLDGNGGIRKDSVVNIQLLLDNDQAFANVVAWDDFSEMLIKTKGVKGLPIRKGFWTDEDDAVVRSYMERKHNLLFSKQNEQDAMVVVGKEHSINPVKDWIEAEQWDGTPRAERYFIDYLGAEDSEYTRAVTRKWLAGAVKRVYQPGCKFELVPILEGKQGLGKSTAARNLFPKKFSDSLKSMGKTDEDYKKLQGNWIMELGELSAMKKTEIESAKSFISAQSDSYRGSYSHYVYPHLRKCVFIGSTNQQDYLKDATGERRFFPIRCGVTKPTKTVWRNEESVPKINHDIHQVLAEVKTWVDAGESVFADDKLMQLAKPYQQEAETVDPMKEAIEDFLNMKVPSNWENLSLSLKASFFHTHIDHNGDVATWLQQHLDAGELQPLQQTTTREIMEVVFDKSVDRYLMGRTGSEAKRIKLIMDNMDGWDRERVRINGQRSRGYVRK